MPTQLPLPAAVLDTDTFNEVDDQFALAHLLLSPSQVNLEAVYAAPFSNDRAATPAEGMEKSYGEILRVLKLVGGTATQPSVYRGSTTYLNGPRIPVESAAARNLVERALAQRQGRLHVLAIGACTNVASALLMEPKIAGRITITWLGGHAPHWSNTDEFNLRQDVHASRVLLDTDAPFLLVPCDPVASHLAVTVPELEAHLAPYSALGTYLTDIVRAYGNNAPGWSKVIWDIAVSASLINPKWIRTVEEESPLLNDDLTWGDRTDRRKIRIARQLERDAIFADFYTKTKALGLLA